jgi:hypothetical protein
MADKSARLAFILSLTDKVTAPLGKVKMGFSDLAARLIGPGNATELRQALLAGDAPGHEWVLCAGALLVGSEKGLSFVRELVGL